MIGEVPCIGAPIWYLHNSFPLCESSASRLPSASPLKISPDAVGDSAGRLRELVTRLRRRGYPAARLLASGQVAGLTFWLQEQLPGIVLERVPVPSWLIPQIGCP